jgi:hypothetical protein
LADSRVVIARRSIFHFPVRSIAVFSMYVSIREQ